MHIILNTNSETGLLIINISLYNNPFEGLIQACLNAGIMLCTIFHMVETVQKEARRICYQINGNASKGLLWCLKKLRMVWIK